MSEITARQAPKSLDYYLYHGLYPGVYHDNLNPTSFYSNYLQTYVERDVRQILQIKDLSAFQLFIRLCAARVGQIFNAVSLSNEVGVSSNTIQHWLSVLEASFVIFRLQPYFENFGKRLIKSPKIYFTDVGLATYCLSISEQSQIARDPLRGQLVENLMVADLIKHFENKGLPAPCYFYRDSNQNEVDVLIQQGRQLIPIEIKSSKTFHPDFLKGIQYFRDLVRERCQEAYLIYAGEREQTIQGTHVINFLNTKRVIK